MKLYVQADSKKALNERLAKGEKITGHNFSFFEDGGDHRLDDTLRAGTVIAIFNRRTSDGTPIAKSYGTWQKGKVA